MTDAIKKELILLKLKALYYGVDISEEAFLEIQKVDTKFRRGFFYFHSTTKGANIPHEFLMPGEIVTALQYRKNSPLIIDHLDGKFFIKNSADEIQSYIRFPQKPKFYDKISSDGIRLSEIIQIAGRDCVRIYTSDICEFEKLGDTCRYCSIGSDRSSKKRTYRTPKQIAEAFKEAFSEGYYGHVMIAAGTYPAPDRGLLYMRDVLTEMQEATGISKVSGSVSTTAPNDLKFIETVYNAGVEYLTLNLEVFDPVLFDKYCPGKSKDIGRKQYFDSFKTAVDLFGVGKVRSNFVAGLEPLDSLFKGFEELGSMGVVPTAMVLTINEGNSLGTDFMRPDLDYYIEVYKKLEEIYSKFGIRPPWCSKCRTASLENEGMFL